MRLPLTTLVLGLFVATGGSSCSGSSAAPSPSAQPAAAPQPGDAPPPADTAASTPPASDGEPQTAKDCTNLLSTIENPTPDDGEVMNNAQPSEEAGSSDRLAAILEVVNQNRDGFRCCFDLWGKKNPGQSGEVLLEIELTPDGEVREAKLDHDKSDLHAQEVESCMVDVAKAISYPESPSGKDTVYRHPFRFKAQN